MSAGATREKRFRLRHARQYQERNYVGLSPYQTAIKNVAVPDDVQRFEGVPTPCGFCGAGRVLCRHRAAVL